MTDQIDSSWKEVIFPLMEKESMRKLFDFIQAERAQHQVYPPKEHVFEAFKLTPLNKVKVVILGQDPYHNEGQAHGLSFSVPKGIVTPASLRNIYKELQQDIPCFEIPADGDLTSWAKQGVLLLNATLTVRAHQAGSHQKRGWEEFTDAIIQIIADTCEHVVFLLWGGYAKKKNVMIDTRRHLILYAAHPSPLSAYRGFLGCGHFSKANAYLRSHNKTPINWCL